MKELERLLSRRLDRIRHANEPGGPAIGGHEHDRLSIAPQRLGPLVQTSKRHAEVVHQPAVPQGDSATGDATQNPLPGDRPEFLRWRERQPAAFGPRDNRCGERMLTAALDAGGEPEHIRLRKFARRLGRDELRFALGERSSLVHHECVDPLQHLECLGVLDEHSGGGPSAGADHDRHRGRESERARARDDQDGDCVDDGERGARLGSHRRPDDRRHDRDEDDRGHEPGRDHVGEPLDRGPAALRLAHHLHDLSE